ncbi:beta-ketoacyl synthase chain length factor [Dyadobacter psychrotolerans]|uniref:Beta-ketoacyl synthase-like N-terminal domain-containing protein n=1 Tax=Dyadobacter psychrotolerans TaxID=2541721 RepID=A0A4R5DHQ9_9BACT|nr:beta-ketoacyl synthase chain length factor [Dyadobacter psychrotolerans]TDE10295.1 hypothetical protein E0F88_28805 [Dyadobacter psychrotolerans]
MFITDLSCISPQQTYDDTFLSGEIKTYLGNRYVATEPPYGSLIPAGLLRRMGKAVRMGVGAGLPLIHKNPKLDGIILGTANGGLEDCLKFLNQIVDYKEGTLTPTNFVQSTPNAVAGNLALMSKNTGYNTTHVHKGLAFECALLDAMLWLDEGNANSFLLGSVEEISEYHYNIDYLSGYFKKEDSTSATLLQSGTAGTVCGEGATMFVVESELSERALAEIVDVEQISYALEDELTEKLNYLLKRNQVDPEQIDALVLGYSGDSRNDDLYDNLHQRMFSHSSVYSYKNLTGDYPTSSAFATWLGVQILSGRHIPDQAMQLRKSEITPKYVLIYNHYQGVQHGLILLKAV